MYACFRAVGVSWPGKRGNSFHVERAPGWFASPWATTRNHDVRVFVGRLSTFHISALNQLDLIDRLKSPIAGGSVR
jgi:hypothetical protein